MTEAATVTADIFLTFFLFFLPGTLPFSPSGTVAQERFIPLQHVRGRQLAFTPVTPWMYVYTFICVWGAGHYSFVNVH